MTSLSKYSQKNKNRAPEIMSLEAYITKCKKDPSLYASPYERILKAIGEPELVDTGKDDRLSRIFSNRVLPIYKPFHDFYGLEDVIHKIVSFFKHASQGLEESRQILYLLGPVGSAKSSLAERLKKLMEQEPIYVLATENGKKISPIYETPLCLFTEADAEDLKLDKKYLNSIPSPWAIKRLDEVNGDLSTFSVVKLYPDQLRQIAISKTEPGDENNQDISTLVGKLNIRRLQDFDQNDPDAYSYTGGLCLGNRGILEFVEMFKAPIKVLHPLLTATQEHNYKGVESISAIPFEGIILAHSNESEWDTFKNDKTNEAFLDRVYIVEVPYCLRVTEEIKIYKKFLDRSSLIASPCTPATLKLLAEFVVLTRLEDPENSSYLSKLKTYDGEKVKSEDNQAKSYQEYKDLATNNEGFFGLSTRIAYKMLSEAFNFDPQEIAADPVVMFQIIERTINSFHLAQDQELIYFNFVHKILIPRYVKKIGKEIQTAYLDSYGEYGQSLFDRYLNYADHWIQDNDYRDPETGAMFDRDALNQELEVIEKPAGIVNPKDFRHEVVHFALRHRAQHNGKNPSWTSYEKLRKVIETTLFSKTQDLLPVISFEGHGTEEAKKKHKAFIDRMTEKGYTEKQVRRIVEWHTRLQKAD